MPAESLPMVHVEYMEQTEKGTMRTQKRKKKKKKIQDTGLSGIDIAIGS